MRRWVIVSFAVLLVGALGVLLWRALRERDLLYAGTPVRVWLRRAVAGQDHQADEYLNQALRTPNPVLKAQIQKQLVRCVMTSLKTKDNPLWKPYTFVRTNLPSAISTAMPAWPEPKRVRWNAVWWLFMRAVAGANESTPPGLFDRAMPVVYDLAWNDPDKAVRNAATWTVGMVGTNSPAALQIMLRALNSTDREDITAGAKWFYRYPIEPERVVPLLAKGFANPSARGDCAMTLRVYGPRAKLAVERLVTFARTNDPAVSSVAIWVLDGIDPAAAYKVGATER